MDGAVEMLQALYGSFHLYLATNGTASVQKSRLKSAEIEPFFEQIFISEELGCNKLALGHHKDDAVETFIMNLFDQGRLGCFSPVSYLSRKDLTVIRPLILAEEKEVRQAVRRENFPIIKSSCPVDGHTEREWAKQWVREMEHQKRDIKSQIFGAMRRAHINDW